ncbi:MAG: hypothetical protein WCB68_18205 [Pyrinomonadaceae bacterium]
MKVVSTHLNATGLPQDGLSIICPSDESYGRMVETLLQDQRNAVVETLQPYSVFIKNTGTRTVVACRLKWEMRKADGTVKTENTGFVTLWRLMNRGASGTGGYVIKPNSTRFFSPFNLDLNQDLNSNGDAVVINTALGGPIASQEEQIQANYLRKVAADLAQYVDIRVSLDGAFFDDGTFVGPDSTNFYSKVEASRNARRDLLRELETDVKQGNPAREVFKRVELLSGEPNVKVSPSSTSAEFYSFYKKNVAKEILKMREKAGEEKTLEFAAKSLQKEWIQLKKN